MVASNALFVLLAGPLVGSALMAQDAPSKVFRYEISAAWLGLTPKGNVLTNSNRVDFSSDLGIDRMQSQAAFRALILPWNRSGLYFEFTPYRFSGENTITRSFRFGGVTYNLNEQVTSKASLNYFSVGYHYDVLTRERLELGFEAGAAYLGVRARANSPSSGSAEVNRDIPFPLVGVVARYLPPADLKFSLRGEARGMTFGSYGFYFNVGGGIAFHLTSHTSLEVGYRVIDGDGHHKTRGAELNFRGPSVTFRLYD